MKKKQFPLCIPPLIICLLDFGVTLWGQSAAYWEGDWWIGRDGAPHGEWLLQQHPSAFAAAAFGYLVLCVFLILVLPFDLAAIFSFALVLGHTPAAFTWVEFLMWQAKMLALFYYLKLIGFFLMAVLIVLCWNRARRD